MSLFLIFILAMLVSMALIPPLMKTATHWRIVDVPDERKLHVGAIPRVGGAAMMAGAALAIVVWTKPEPPLLALLVGTGIVFMFGLWDDWRNLDFRVKFLGQLIAVFVVMGYGGVMVRYLPMLGDYPLPTFVAAPITVFVLLGITNAINLSDGLDGLAGGLTLMSLGIVAMLAFLAERVDIALVAMAVIGGIVGFIRFNTHPAKVFMGDGGSQFLGFTVGVLSLLLTQQPHAMYSYALPLIVLALPILDTTMVIVQRLYQRRSPFAPDKNHIHHKLLALGFDHHEAVVVLYVLQAALFVSAYLLRYENDTLVLLFFFGFCSMIVSSLGVAWLRGWRVRDRSPGSGAREASARRQQRFESGVFKSMLILVSVAMPAYLLAGVSFCSTVSVDVAVLAGVMLLVLVAHIAYRGRGPLTWAERGIVYVTICVVVYLSQTTMGAGQLRPYGAVFIVVLAVALVLALRYSAEKKFEPTTLDFLVLFVAIAVPNLPGLKLLDADIGEIVAKAIVMFYGIELVLAHRADHYCVVRWVTSLVLGLVLLRAVGQWTPLT